MKYDVKVKKLPKSEAEIEVSLPSELLSEARNKAIKGFGAAMEIDGFRKGKVPENMVIEKVGEKNLLEEAADILLKQHFPKIAAEESFDIIGSPKISVTKLAFGNPMEFKATFALLPSFDLPDYKKIASSSKQLASSKDNKIEATDKEVDEVLLQIRKNKAHFDYHKKNPEDKNHSHAGLDLEKEENLPPLNDELAKEAGNFKNLDDLKEKVRQNIIGEKKRQEEEKRRAAMMDELVKETKIELPEILAESEVQKSLAQMKDDIARVGGVWEDYLSHIKKSEEDLKKDLRDPSEKKAKIQLIFNKIAEAEKLEPNKEILEQEVKHILEHYKGTSEENARIYVATILLNQEVLRLLEEHGPLNQS